MLIRYMLRRLATRVLSLVAALSLPICSIARGDAPIAFRHVGMEAGLTHERVNSVCSGQRGFLWVSTLWGLDCYDGYSVTSFAVPDSVLCGGDILGVQEYGPDTMLVRMSTGMALFSRSQLAFSRADCFLREHGAVGGKSDVWTDGRQNLWSLGRESILFSPVSGRGFSFPLPDGVEVACLSPSRFGFAVLLADGRLIRCSPPAPGCAPSPQVFTTPMPSGGKTMRTDDNGGLWVISHGGDSLWHKPLAGLGWELVNSQPFWDERVPKGLVDVAVDASRRIWLVSEHNGACLVDPVAGSVVPLKRDASLPFSLHSNLCTCVEALSSGTVAIGYQHSGFSIYHPAAFKFSPLCLSQSASQNLLSDVRSVASDGMRCVYVGSNAGGVVKVDVPSRKASRLHISDSNGIESLAALPDGSLWAFVSGRGFVRYSENSNGGELVCFAQRRDSPDPLTENSSSGSLAVSRGGTLWVAAARQVLALPSAATPGDKFRGCAAASLDDEVVTLREGRDSSSVIVLTRSSFYMATLHDGHVELARLSDRDLRADRPSDICQGVHGFFWVATASGVAVFSDPDSSGCARFLKNVELAQPAVSLAPCLQGGALAATSSEVCLFKVYPAGNGGYRIVTGRYNAASGLLPGVNAPRTAITLPSGDVWIGSEAGINVYSPWPDDGSAVPMVSFSSLTFNGGLVLPGQSIGGVVPLSRAIPLCGSVSLPSGCGSFAVNFSVLGAPSPRCYSYLCEVVGADIPPSTSLEPCFVIPDIGDGSFTLRVTAVDPEGRLSECPAELKVVFRAPWYMSSWLRFSVVAILVAAVCAVVIRLVLRRVRMSAASKLERQDDLSDFVERPALSSEIEALVLKSVAANVATSIDVLADDIRALSDVRGLPLTDSLAIRNLTYRLISANSALAAVAGASVAAESDGAAPAGRYDIVAATRTTVRQIAAITHSSQSVGFSSPLRNCIFSFDADAFRTVLIDIVVDAIVSTAGQGFVRVLVEKGKYGADLVSVSVCIGGELPSTSLYFNAGGGEPALPFNVEACLHRLKASVRTSDFGDGLIYAYIHIPAGD